MTTTLNVDAASKYLNIGTGTLYALVEEGVIPAAKIGQQWVFRESDLAKYLAQEVERQTAERIAARNAGKPAKIVTGFGQVKKRRRELPDLSKYPVVA